MLKKINKHMGFKFSCWLNPVMRLYSRSKILPALLISGARCHLWSVQMYVHQWHRTPKGSQAPVKVNSHHLNLSAPPINSNSCQKLRWMRTVHGWVAFDEMWVVECITKCQHVFSWIQPCQLHTGNERLPLRRDMQLGKIERHHLWLWHSFNFEVVECP